MTRTERLIADKRIFLILLVLLSLLVLGLIVPAAHAQAARPEEGGATIRLNGDVRLGEEEQEDLVVVINGHAQLAGTAEVAVVVNGTTTLAGARVGQLIVVDGRADLQEGTVVTGEVHLVDAELVQAEEAVVEGVIRRDANYRIGRGLLIFGLVFGLGYAAMVILSGLAAAAVAPRKVRAAGALLTEDFGSTLIATLVIWILLPVAAVLALLTVIGIPTGLAILIFLLPALGFIGYMIAGIRLGDFLLERKHGTIEPAHPYRAAAVGLLLLLVAGGIPVVGSVVTPVAAFLGSGALALAAWRAARRTPAREEHMSA